MKVLIAPCAECVESVEKCAAPHIVSEWENLAQKEYKRRHDNDGKKVHWDLCKKHELEHRKRWYEHIPQGAVEKYIEASRPDVILINKRERERVSIIVDIAVPADRRKEEKEKVGISRLEV